MQIISLYIQLQYQRILKFYYSLVAKYYKRKTDRMWKRIEKYQGQFVDDDEYDIHQEIGY